MYFVTTESRRRALQGGEGRQDAAGRTHVDLAGVDRGQAVTTLELWIASSVPKYNGGDCV